MKPKYVITTIIVVLASSFAGMAQNNPAAGDPAAGTPAVVSSNAPPGAAEAPAQAVATPSGAAQPGAVIPIIVMDEAKLTDAIRNLARMAGLNYMLDPKIGFGQPDPANPARLLPEPTVSIRWENVTAEQALLALLNNYNLQYIEDPKSRIARVTTKDPAAPPPLITKVIQLKYAGPTNILSAVQNTMTDKRSKVVADVRTSQLVVLATEQEQADVDLLVERLDLQTKQVLIETRLLEISANPTTAKGIDWSGTLTAQNFTWGNGSMTGNSTTTIPGVPGAGTLPSGRTSQPSSSTATVLNSVIGGGGIGYNTVSGLSPATGFLTADGVKAVLSFINKDADAKTISAPRTVTLDNEEARIEVVRANPIINVTAGTANTTGGSSITYTNLGVILKVTPRISANNFVNLRVHPEVSRVFETRHIQSGTTATGQPNSFDVDVYDIRRLDTHVMIPSGNTLVLGGLIQDDVRNQSTKVPILGDVPGLGYFFRSEAKQRQKGNLIIFLTPTIVQDEDYMPTKTDYLKTPVPAEDDAGPAWTPWDTAKPYDWSKPAVDPSQQKAQPDQFK